MVITRTVEMHAQLVGYDFKKKGLPTDKNIVECCGCDYRNGKTKGVR